jgi:hypothetical protein
MIPLSLVPAIIGFVIFSIFALYLTWSIRRDERRDGRKP